MRRIDFYKKKRKLHEEIIGAICKVMDANMVEEIDFEKAGMDGGYVLVGLDSLVCEKRVLKIKHVICTNNLKIMAEDTGGCDDRKWFSLNDNDVLNASFDTVYETIYDLFYSKHFKEARKQLSL